VGGGREEDQVPGRVVGQGPYQLVPLLHGLVGAPHRPVGLVHDDQVGGAFQEEGAVAVVLEEVDAGHHDLEAPVEVAPRAQPPLQAGQAPRRDHHRLEGELLPKLLRPLVQEMGRGQDRQPPGHLPVQELPGDEGRLHGLPHPHVVGDEEAHGVQAEGHQEGDQLVGPGPDPHPAQAPEGGRPVPQEEPGPLEEEAELLG
jgi:hypothetical protein